MTSITVEATKPLGVKPRDAERSKNFFALGLDLLDVHAPDRAAASTGSRSASRTSPRCSTRTSPRSRPATTSARPPSCSTTPTRSSPRSCRRASTATSPATSRCRTGSSPPRSRRSCRCSTRRTRSRRRPTSCTSCRSYKNFGVTHAAGRGRDRGRAASRSAPRSPGSLGVTGTSGPGVDLKSEALGLAVSLELPLIIVDVQRGGPSTGLPTKTEQADLLLAMYGRHGEAPLPIVAAQLAEPLLRRRVRGGAHRGEVPHAGDPAHRRLPRQRRRAVGAPRRRRAARHLGAVRDRAQPRRRVLAVPPRPRDARPAVGDPGHARPACTASAASRRRTAPATSTTTPRTTRR